MTPHYPQLNRDLLLMGGFLHDIGKIDELIYDRGLGYSDEGQLVGHLVQGVSILERKLFDVEQRFGEPFPNPLAMQLKHMIVSHHGKLEFGSPKVPMTLEATALHYLDDMDAKLHSFEQLMREDANVDSPWTVYHPQLGQKAFQIRKGDADLHDERFRSCSSSLEPCQSSGLSAGQAAGDRQATEASEELHTQLKREIKRLVKAGQVGIRLESSGDRRRATAEAQRSRGHVSAARCRVTDLCDPRAFASRSVAVRTSSFRRPRPRMRQRETWSACGQVAGGHARGSTRISGEIVEIVERGTTQFVGTYEQRNGVGLVRIDGTDFSHPVLVGDPGAKNVQPGDKVVLEMIRYPSSTHERRRRRHGGSGPARPTGRRYPDRAA